MLGARMESKKETSAGVPEAFMGLIYNSEFTVKLKDCFSERILPIRLSRDTFTIGRIFSFEKVVIVFASLLMTTSFWFDFKKNILARVTIPSNKSIPPTRIKNLFLAPLSGFWGTIRVESFFFCSARKIELVE